MRSKDDKFSGCDYETKNGASFTLCMRIQAVVASTKLNAIEHKLSGETTLRREATNSNDKRIILRIGHKAFNGDSFA